jgi:hypothetical protein
MYQAINQEILADCERKAGQSLLDLLRKATSAVAPDPDAAYELFHQCVRLRQEHKVRSQLDEKRVWRAGGGEGGGKTRRIALHPHGTMSSHTAI